MSYTSYAKHTRALLRSAEIAAASDTPEDIKSLHADILADLASAYLAADDEVPRAQGRTRQARAESVAALAALDAPFHLARQSIAARFPNTTLPRTLKVQRTDTDRTMAIDALFTILERHSAEPWASRLLTGTFGTLARDALAKVAAAESSELRLASALAARAAAKEASLPPFLAFKRMVRHAPGPQRVNYRRLHPRAGHSEPAAESTRPAVELSTPRLAAPKTMHPAE